MSQYVKITPLLMLSSHIYLIFHTVKYTILLQTKLTNDIFKYNGVLEFFGERISFSTQIIVVSIKNLNTKGFAYFIMDPNILIKILSY